MALFKVCRGKESDLPEQRTDGFAYFCRDSRNFFIDCTDAEGKVVRMQINSDCANKIRYSDETGEYIEADLASYIDGRIVHEFLGGEW